MKRTLEFTDVMAVIGMVATMFGGYLFYQASYGGAFVTMTPADAMTNPSTKSMVQSMLQPALGQVIVDQATLERQFAHDITRGASNLYRASLIAERRPIGGLDTIESQATQLKADHSGRVQHMMGQAIVALTSRGIRVGALSADNLSNSFNDRIIARAKGIKDFLESTFAQRWQARLGQWIVDAATKEWRFAGRMQERMGQEIVNLAMVQENYLARSVENRIQRQALTAAVTRTETQSHQFMRLVRFDGNFQQILGVQSMPGVEVMELRMLPEIPFRYMLAALFGLSMVLVFGLSFPGGRREPENLVDRIQALRREIFLKVS